MPDAAAKVPDSAGYGSILPDHVSPQAGVILAHLHQHGDISTAQAAALLNVKARRARTVLVELIDQGLLKKRGSARQTIYVRSKAG
jgi:predicted HTH transcriptional regulator